MSDWGRCIECKDTIPAQYDLCDACLAWVRERVCVAADEWILAGAITYGMDLLDAIGERVGP